MASPTSARATPPLDIGGGSRHGAGMTGSELRDLLVGNLARAHGGGTARWRKVVGAVKVYSRDTHAHCNWEIRPAGAVHEIAIVEHASDLVRARHPFVEAD